MSPITKLGLLAFAATTLAIPSAHDHRHLHERRVDRGVLHAPDNARVAAPSAATPSAAAAASAAPAAAGSNVPATPSGGAAPRTGGGAGFAGGKRGLAYNSAADCNVFLSSPSISWGYNWVSDSQGLSSQVQYIPTLHSGDSTWTSTWAANAAKGIAGGAQYLFSFNEPDIPSQANMQPGDAAQAWKQYMEPFAGKAQLVAPSVSNSQSPGQGLDWLKQFMAACQGCTIDAVNMHWYDSTSNDLTNFKSQVQAAGNFGKPVFVSEFAFVGSDEDISQSLGEAMSYLDAEPNVVGYSYFMVGDGYLNDGTGASPYGLTYIGK